uniref:Putative secreted protein n=1 Tax=Rhipicephalus microplus TaxID=6941 RepID=A0A6M2DAE4_RHIMP
MSPLGRCPLLLTGPLVARSLSLCISPSSIVSAFHFCVFHPLCPHWHELLSTAVMVVLCTCALENVALNSHINAQHRGVLPLLLCIECLAALRRCASSRCIGWRVTSIEQQRLSSLRAIVGMLCSSCILRS